MSVLYFDCISGAAGDMLLAALIDAGASETAVRGSLDGLGLSGWELVVTSTDKSGLRCKQVAVSTSDGATSRRHSDIKALLERASLPASVKRRALETFRVLAEAEAKIHGHDPEEVHFHEVGAVDALIDIVGCSAALEDLAPTRIAASGLVTGRGWADSAHGQLPVPAPAVLEILRGVPLAERGTDELVTPTGAAILKTATDSFGAMPTMSVDSVGYGAGQRDLPWPNVVRVLIGREGSNKEDDDRSWLIETNIDDMNPELIPNCIERLIGAGASDAWTSPIVMKKGRPAFTLAVLVRESARNETLDVLYRETTTLGVRMHPVTKDELEREWLQVQVLDQQVRVKLGLRGRHIVSVSPEYEDALLAARAEDVPLREIYDKAIAEATTRLKKRL